MLDCNLATNQHWYQLYSFYGILDKREWPRQEKLKLKKI